MNSVKLFRWIKGRQPDSKYKVFTIIFSIKFLLDCVIIKYPTGAGIAPHVDTIEDGRHYRLNIVLWSPRKGGKFICGDTIFSIFNRVHFFRPDLNEHSVTTVEDGVRYVLSIGKSIKDVQ